ncbi:MAG TPA: polyketide synthase dehydratase domain-containing protein, partial [Saliniramus sp.]|nr:polyketide synthase dehydratase domain-containing protein [Saliniramus sp.]
QRFASIASSVAVPDPLSITADLEGLAPISKTDFYAGMASNGIDLGPTLQRLDDIRAGAGAATALVRVTADDAHGFGSPIHPCILDGMFQVLAAATQSTLDASGVVAPHVPVSVEGIVLSGKAIQVGPMRCRAVLRPADPARDEIVGDIALFDEDGTALVQVVGLASRPIQTNAISFLHEIRWVEESRRDLPTPDRVASEIEKPAIDADRHARYVAAIDRLAAAYVARALDALVPVDKAVASGLVPKRYARLVDRYIAMLRDEGLLDGAGRPRDVQAEPQEIARAISAEFPDHEAETRMLVRCGSALGSVLAGDTDPVELLFAPGTEEVGELYGESEIAGALNAMLADAVDRATRERRDLRILEIGGGTGGTTRHVLGRVKARLADYLFTDVSAAFLDAAEERFAECEAFRTALFNVERAPEGQEISPEACDVVIAANVLHAAGDLGDAVDHASAALAAGGWLVLMEGLAPSRWLDLTFGLTAGWWNQLDTETRPDYPLIDSSAWRRLLTEKGFDSIEIVTLGPDGLIDQGIILARKGFGPSNARLLSEGLGNAGARDKVLGALQGSLTPNARLLIATSGAAQVRPHEVLDAAQAAVAGLAKAVALEEPDADVRIVDV